MTARLSDQQICAAFQRALAHGHIGQEDTAILFHDLSFLEERITELSLLFPDTALHAIAIKANPLQKIIKKINTLGVGVEAATLPELHLATSAGFSPAKIVFDSPAKTAQELAFAHTLGVHINADSLSDLDRIGRIVKDDQPKGTIGVRINPQVGTGKILSTSTAGDYSKFGIPIKEYRQELMGRFIEFPWLQGVHIHIGSQGISLEQLIRGIGTIMDFVHEVNGCLKKKNIHRRIDIIDIGGGLPVSYHRDQAPIPMAQYQAEIKKHYPELFGPDFRLITEFGRYIHTNAGWVVSRVENVKKDRDIDTVMIHVGADLFLRECYNPDDWKHEITVLDSNGNLKSGYGEKNYMIAGPLCFAGDLIARDIPLPKIDPGDFIVIHDTGAYTLSMWSRYNSRQIPKVVGYYQDGQKFEVLKERESIEQILAFWA
jgi:diaminopimelate decarboxylase